MDLMLCFFFSLLICAALPPACSAGGSGEGYRVISWSPAEPTMQVPSAKGSLGHLLNSCAFGIDRARRENKSFSLQLLMVKRLYSSSWAILVLNNPVQLLGNVQSYCSHRCAVMQMYSMDTRWPVPISFCTLFVEGKGCSRAEG